MMMSLGNHDRQRDRCDDDHGRGCGKPADEGDHGEHRNICRQRQRQQVEIGIAGTGKGQHAGNRDGQHEQVDGNKVDWKQDACGAQVLFRPVFHHRYMELARQHDDGKGGQDDEQDPARQRRLVVQCRHHLLVGQSLGPQVTWTVEQEEDHVDPGRDQSEQLHHRFHRNRQDQSVLMFGCVGMARAEDDGEAGEEERDQERQVDEVLS
jgi:hypothetical protein